MTGEQIPFVLIPRFTGLVGAQDFTTVPLDRTPYAGATVVLWRGPFVDGTATLKAFFETSTDLVTWAKVPGPNPLGEQPGEGDAGALTIALPFTRRWFRMRLELRGSTTPAVTCWCAGNVELMVN